MKVNAISTYSYVQNYVVKKNQNHGDVSFKSNLTGAATLVSFPPLLSMAKAIIDTITRNDNKGDDTKSDNNEKEEVVLPYSEEYHPSEDLAFTNY